MSCYVESDIIVHTQGGPVAVYSKASNSYELYDPFLNKVEHTYDIRYVKAGRGYWLTLLIGNELVGMVGDKIGNNLQQLLGSYSVCGTVSRYTNEIIYADGKIKLEKVKDHSMTRQGLEYLSFDIINTQGIDSLYFNRMTTKQSYSANNISTFYRAANGVTAKDILYAKMKNGKYNLYTYKEINSKVYKQIEENITSKYIELATLEELAKTYSTGEIELEQLLAHDVDSIDMFSYPIIFQNNGLKGIYGINTEARYTALGKISNNLIRYTLPSGKQDWLDLDSGKELDDI